MKSRTSFFNATALRKDITRFAPVWALYSVFLLLCLTVITDFDGARASIASSFRSTIKGMSVVSLCYALLNAELLYGDLYRVKMCNALHALPLRREGWLAVHTAAGLLFAFVPNALVALVSAVLLLDYAAAALWWMLAADLMYLFFFALATLSAQCAGNRFALAAVYFICNFLSLIVAWALNSLYLPLLRGVELDYSGFERFCPVVYMMEFSYASVGKDQVHLEAGWGYLGVCAAVALVLFAAALLLYRRRKLESAGDFVAVPWLKPVLLVIYTLCVGVVFRLFYYLFTGRESVAFLIIGIVIGFFTGQMALQRTVRVFRPKALIGLAALLGALGVSLLVTWLDPFGRVGYIPGADRIEQVQISGYTLHMLTEKSDFATVTALHEALLESPESDSGTRISLEYTLKNGKKLSRSYCVSQERAAQLAELRTLYCKPSYFFGELGDDPQALFKAVKLIYGYSCEGEFSEFYITDAADRQGLLEAILSDIADGSMIQSRIFHSGDSSILYGLEVQYTVRNADGFPEDTTAGISVYADCKNTLAWLNANVPRISAAQAGSDTDPQTSIRRNGSD